MKLALKRLKRAAQVLWLLLAGCASKPPPVTPQQASDSAACNLAYTRIIASSASCHEAQLRLDVDPACRPFTRINLECKNGT